MTGADALDASDFVELSHKDSDLDTELDIAKKDPAAKKMKAWFTKHFQGIFNAENSKREKLLAPHDKKSVESGDREKELTTKLDKEKKWLEGYGQKWMNQFTGKITEGGGMAKAKEAHGRMDEANSKVDEAQDKIAIIKKDMRAEIEAGREPKTSVLLVPWEKDVNEFLPILHLGEAYANHNERQNVWKTRKAAFDDGVRELDALRSGRAELEANAPKEPLSEEKFVALIKQELGSFMYDNFENHESEFRAGSGGSWETFGELGISPQKVLADPKGFAAALARFDDQFA